MFAVFSYGRAKGCLRIAFRYRPNLGFILAMAKNVIDLWNWLSSAGVINIIQEALQSISSK